MIYLGIDDTDMVGSPGTNQLALAIAARLAGAYECRFIVRHQLLVDPRVPCTSKNGSASILLQPVSAAGPPLRAVAETRAWKGRPTTGELLATVRDVMHERFVAGSDPGLCLAEEVPPEVVQFGRRCQRELVEQHEAFELASKAALWLEGLGGTGGGVIGALAAVGLAATGDDGRVVSIGAWPDDLCGSQPVAALRERGVAVQCADTGRTIDRGSVDVGKRLRPSFRGGAAVLFVRPSQGPSCNWIGLKLT
ncbi:MAG: ABC transporter substrate-binding protein [Planctomycetia bacterium]|nr:ABC transporter substrate-binding protein [Planctomycetia bacterium]